MSYEKISIHENFDLERRKENLKKIVPNEKEYKKVLEHIRGLANGTLNGTQISERRQVKIIDAFMFFFKHYRKPSSEFVKNKENAVKFKEDLLNNKIKKQNGNNYKDKTKEDFTEIIARFLEDVYYDVVSKWNNRGVSFRKWFVIPASKTTPEVLTEEEVTKLYEATKSIEGKAIISVLFDSGSRIEEFLNIRFEDIEQPTMNNPYFRIDLKEEYSKTEGRKIGLYWKNTTEALSKYLAAVKKESMKDQVFPLKYDAVRMFLSRLTKKSLGKNITPHTLRKSSATFYADKLNRQQLCIRFGWKFSSEMPDVYISRSGVDEAKVKDVLFNDDLNTMKRESKESKTKIDLQAKKIEALQLQLQEMAKGVAKILNKTDKNKGWEAGEVKLSREGKPIKETFVPY